MREINLGGETKPIAASLLTLNAYKREFGTDLVADFYAMFSGKEFRPQFTTLLQILWAMLWTAAAGRVPAYQEWLKAMDGLVFFDDDELLEAVTDEVDRAFFRGGGSPVESSADSEDE